MDPRISRVKTLVRLPFTLLGIASRPSFLIIGAQKAGTSGLHQVLDQHPDLCGTELKEVHYFDNDQWYSSSHIGQYLSRFPLPFLQEDQRLFESTPVYLYHPKAAERIRQFDPNMKMIVLLRDPAARALSAWKMYHYGFKTGAFQHLHDPRSFSEAIKDELKVIDSTTYYTNPVSYVNRGIYAEQLERYFEFFDRDQILILEQNEILDQLNDTLEKITAFIGVDNAPLQQVIANKGRTDLDEDVSLALDELRAFYRPHNEKLTKLLETQFSWT